MTMFRVGQRVRKIAQPRHGLNHPVPLLAEGVIADRYDKNSEYCWLVRYDCMPGSLKNAADYMLAPLTDPAADSWASEQVRKWTKPEPVTPVVVKEKA